MLQTQVLTWCNVVILIAWRAPGFTWTVSGWTHNRMVTGTAVTSVKLPHTVLDASARRKETVPQNGVHVVTNVVAMRLTMNNACWILA